MTKPVHRRALASVDEPNAFRISRPPPSQDPALRHEPSTPASFRARDPPPEPASWLPVTQLTSPNFNPHNFLQKALSQRFEKSARPSQIPLLDDSFDADAALAALDTVESALRRLRDLSKAEESAARDNLRNALHLSAKKRQTLIATADSVTSQVATSGQVGTTAASALSSDIACLHEHSARLSELNDARDILALLTLDTSELDAVRVSRLLARARVVVDQPTLAELLSREDLVIARDELKRCEAELAESVFDWMRTAADSGNAQVVRDCAVAAANLNIETQFVQEYVKHAFAFDHVQQDPYRSGQSQAFLEPFRNACWEAANAVKDLVPTILESFAAPSKPLATLVQMLVERRVVVVADALLNYVRQSIRGKEAILNELRSNAAEAVQAAEQTSSSSDRSSAERKRGLAIVDSKDSWREAAKNVSTERQRFLTVCADVFKSIAKLKTELFDLCRVPGAEDFESVFSSLPDPYAEFRARHMAEYLEIEKTWLDDQLGAAFIEITRIELHTPRLAPRHRSDPDVYHRYRAFYGHISSTFRQMTRQAIESTCQSLSRIVTVLDSLPGAKIDDSTDILNEKIDTSSLRDRLLTSAQPRRRNRESLTALQLSKAESTVEDSEAKNGNAHGLSVTYPKSIAEMRLVLREILDCLVMSYLANAETILQAATHLLPVCEADARMQELWISGASPLAAYVQAIEVLSQSNEILDEFLLTLEVPEHGDGIASPALFAEPDLGRLVSPEIREMLHGELTSGLSDLGAEAQIGVRAAVASLRARLYAILMTNATTGAYTDQVERLDGSHRSFGAEPSSNPGLELEPTTVFISAATFVEQQLQSVVTTVNGGNRDFVISELSSITREAVLDCWCACEGTVSIQGALQLIADGKAMTKVFQNRGSSSETVSCLPVIGQLFLESADGLWSCVESKALASVDARTVVTLLRKRDDCNAPRVVKVCQSLGASLQELLPGTSEEG